MSMCNVHEWPDGAPSVVLYAELWESGTMTTRDRMSLSAGGIW